MSEVETFERIMNKVGRKWLGVARCLSTVALYGTNILELPLTRWVEFKCAKTSLELTLSQPADPAVKNTALTVKTGKKRNPQEAVQHSQGALQHRNIVGQVQ